MIQNIHPHYIPNHYLGYGCNILCTFTFFNDVVDQEHVLILCLQVELCRECIDWATNEKRTFLRQALEVRILYHVHCVVSLPRPDKIINKWS